MTRDRLHPVLASIDLVVFDKDGTLIEFDAMWAGWMEALAGCLETAIDRPVRDRLYSLLGFDAALGRASSHGPLATMPMAVLRRSTFEALTAAGVAREAATHALERCWAPPDPVALAHPLADLPALFGTLRAAGLHVAVATSDDRAPTDRTLTALGLAGLVDDVVCADDGPVAKPSPAIVEGICGRLGVTAGRTAIVGDAPADLEMGRAAGVGACVGVLSGTGSRSELEPLADVLLTSVGELLVG
jgi:phosphoglycolate phosphatase